MARRFPISSMPSRERKPIFTTSTSPAGKPAVLVPAAKIAAMAPHPASGKDDRERDNRARYRIAGYHWAPDSQHILFDANGQLWYCTLATGTAVPLSSAGDAALDPK